MILGMILLVGVLLMEGCATSPPPTLPGPQERGGVPPAQGKSAPSVVVLAPVRYILIPGTSIYYVEGVKPEVFYVGGNFYVQFNGVWHHGPDYDGPWALATPNTLPPGLKGQSPPGLKRRIPPS